ncbi:MAG: ATP-dependent Clp protease adapter ClpS [Gemmatimonadaceae bacterium]|nr:ATP-dependent Clp protease adapter ClpS [Gloeobacterales cyanobacterium ES-bin-141]
MSTETLEKKSVQRQPMPLYKVLLHNDSNPMEYVIEILVQTIPQLKPTRARSIMMEAHTSGTAIVILCAQEHAEFYSASLNGHGLTSTFEPDC